MANKLGIYNQDGSLEDVEDDYYDEVETSTGECADGCFTKAIRKVHTGCSKR